MMYIFISIALIISVVVGFFLYKKSKKTTASHSMESSQESMQRSTQEKLQDQVETPFPQSQAKKNLPKFQAPDENFSDDKLREISIEKVKIGDHTPVDGNEGFHFDKKEINKLEITLSNVPYHVFKPHCGQQ